MRRLCEGYQQLARSHALVAKVARMKLENETSR